MVKLRYVYMQFSFVDTQLFDVYMQLSCTDMRNQHIHLHRVDIQKLHIQEIATRWKLYKQSSYNIKYRQNVTSSILGANYLR